MMQVAFVERAAALLAHADRELTMDVGVFRDGGIVAVSPLRLVKYDSEMRVVCVFDADDECGVMTKVACTDGGLFAVLCSGGCVLAFNGACQVHRVELFGVTAIGACGNEFVFGDEFGVLSLYDETLSVCKMEISVSSMPVKAIRRQGNCFLVLSADGILSRACVDVEMKRVDSCDVVNEHVTAFDCCESRTVWALSDGTLVVDGSVSVATKMSVLKVVHIVNDETVFVCNGLKNMGFWNIHEGIFRKLVFPELNSILMCSSVPGHLVLVGDRGIVFAPLVFRSPSCSLPILFSGEKVVEYRQKPSSSVQIPHWKPAEISGSILQVDGEEDDMFLYVKTTCGLYYINRTNSEWGRILDNTKSVKSFSAFRGCLTVLLDNRVLFYTNMQNDASVEVDEALFVSTAENITCVGCQSSLVVFGPGQEKNVIRISERPILARISARMRQVLVLLESKKLISIDLDKAETRDVASNVSNVFVDTNFGMFFVICGIHVKIGQLNTLKLSSLLDTSDVAVGISCPSSALLFQNSMYVEPTISYYFDLSIVGEMDDPHMAAYTLLPMRHSKALSSLLQHVAVFAMREKKGDKCVQFLNYFPEHFDVCITHALRAVESPERAAALSVLGPCHTFFESMWKRNQRMASLLLPVVMEEDGPVIGFTAAIRVLRHFHTSIEDIQSMGRFLDPLLSCPDCSNPDYIVCVGIRLTYDDYTTLRTSLNKAIEFCLEDLISQSEVGSLLPFAEAMQTQLTIFLRKHRTMDAKSDFLVIIEKVDNSEMTRSECRTLANEMLIAGWIQWASGLLWCCGSHDMFWKIMEANPRMKRRFNGSKYSK